jgi:hypothetical protein
MPAPWAKTLKRAGFDVEVGENLSKEAMQIVRLAWPFTQVLKDLHRRKICWTDGFAEGSVGPRPCGNWNIFLAGSGQSGPIAIQPKGDSQCHRCVCG